MKAIINAVVTWTGIHELNKNERKELFEDFVKMIILIFALCAFISVTGM
jgi:hypothetical protein